MSTASWFPGPLGSKAETGDGSLRWCLPLPYTQHGGLSLALYTTSIISRFLEWPGYETAARSRLPALHSRFMDSKAAEYFKKEKVPKYLPLFTVEESYQLLSWIAGAKMSIQMLEKGILCPFQSFLFY